MRGRLSILAIALGLCGGADVGAQPSTSAVGAVPPILLGRTVAESGGPVWPQPVVAQKGSPNILVILTDDVGFAGSSTFGGPVSTPNLDRLAKAGLRYNNFHTAALCSPTRAALLTGRNPHRVGMGTVESLAACYPGYTTVLPKSAATIARILKDNGYNTAMFGKGHITPSWEESQAGPFDRWPTGLGFETFYGFLGPDTNQFRPSLVDGTTFVEPPSDPGYILDRDLADRAIRWMDQHDAVAPEKPFFIYYATGTTHAPIQAPADWIAKFRGQFDGGWDRLREEIFARQKAQGIIPSSAVLTPRPEGLPAWDSISADQKRVAARMMEAYAAAVAHADHQIGRVIDHLRKTGQFDNTMIVFMQGDNGASAEGSPLGALYGQSAINGVPEDVASMVRRIDDIGGPKLYGHYPAGWAWAMNTPFQWYKQVASHFGGTRNGMVLSWPARIREPGGLRSQFSYVTDIVPTILEAAKIDPPGTVDGTAQMSLDGASLMYTVDSPSTPTRHKVQYFEIFQNRGIYADGWFAGTRPWRPAWAIGTAQDKPVDIDSQPWELYHVDADFSQSKDLAKSNPARLRQLQDLFWVEAARNNVLPLHDVREGRAGQPSQRAGRTEFVFNPPVTRIPSSASPPITGASYTIAADIEIGAQAPTGVIATQGGLHGGYAFYLKDGRPTFHYNATGDRQYAVAAPAKLASGRHQLLFTFDADRNRDCAATGSGGNASISVNGRIVARGRIDATLSSLARSREAFDVGADTGTAVNDDYAIPAELGAALGLVVVKILPGKRCANGAPSNGGGH